MCDLTKFFQSIFSAEALVSSIISSAKRDHPEDGSENVQTKKARLEENDDEETDEPKENDQEAIQVPKSKQSYF